MAGFPAVRMRACPSARIVGAKKVPTPILQWIPPLKGGLTGNIPVSKLKPRKTR